MKDECDLSGCSTPEEVKEMIDNYVYYYNNERPQWTRNKMTPAEYEDYLNSLSDNEYSDYLQNEQEKYDKMMKKAREKALKRAVELGALTEEDMELYGSDKKEEQAKNRQKRRDLVHRDAVIEHSDNKFVAELTKNMDAFIYTKDFYVALYKAA